MSMFGGMVVEAGTRWLAMSPNARARRNRRHLSETRAAGQQGQESSDRKDSTDFHCNAPLSYSVWRRGHQRCNDRSKSYQKQ